MSPSWRVRHATSAAGFHSVRGILSWLICKSETKEMIDYLFTAAVIAARAAHAAFLGRLRGMMPLLDEEEEAIRRAVEVFSADGCARCQYWYTPP